MEEISQMSSPLKARITFTPKNHAYSWAGFLSKMFKEL